MPTQYVLHRVNAGVCSLTKLFRYAYDVVWIFSHPDDILSRDGENGRLSDCFPGCVHLGRGIVFVNAARGVIEACVVLSLDERDIEAVEERCECVRLLEEVVWRIDMLGGPEENQEEYDVREEEDRVQMRHTKSGPGLRSCSCELIGRVCCGDLFITWISSDPTHIDPTSVPRNYGNSAYDRGTPRK